MRATRLLSSILVCAAIAAATVFSSAATYKVGQSRRSFIPTHTRNWRGATTHALPTTIWYPAAEDGRFTEAPQFIGGPGRPLFLAGSAAVDAPIAAQSKFPTIMLSHGTGGSALQLAWLGTELARHGYIAAAVDHPGNNALEPYTAEGFALWWERATDISDALDALLLDQTFGPHVDTSRIGAAGFSIGGYTVLELAGTRTNPDDLLTTCEDTPTPPVCRLPEMKNMSDARTLMAQVRATSAESLARGAASYRDPRIRAVFAIAPGAGQAFRQHAFREVTIPLMMVVGQADLITPIAANAGKFHRLMPASQLTILPGRVSHYTFLGTCTAAGKATLGAFCADATGVDRDQVHSTVSGMAVKFFEQNLR